MLRPRSLIVASSLVALLGCGDALAKPTHLPAREVWMTPVRYFGDQVWFNDELAPLAQTVATLLAKPELGGYRVVPPEKSQALLDAIRRGQLPGVPSTCEAVPPPGELARLIYKDAAQADVTIRCADKRCGLEVFVTAPIPQPPSGTPPMFSRRGGTEKELERLRADLAADGNPREWSAQLARSGLTHYTPEGDGGGLLGGVAVAQLGFGDLKQSGPWRAKLVDAVLGPIAAELSACDRDAPVWRDWWGQWTQVELDSAGRVQRCEAKLSDRLPLPRFSCECEALRKLEFGVGAKGRRAEFEIMFPYRPQPVRGNVRGRVSMRGEMASDQSAIVGTREVDEDALTRCLTNGTEPPTKFETAVRFVVAGDGKVTAHQASWPPQLQPAQQRCMDAELARARFTCPLSGHAEVTATIESTVEPLRR